MLRSVVKNTFIQVQLQDEDIDGITASPTSVRAKSAEPSGSAVFGFEDKASSNNRGAGSQTQMARINDMLNTRLASPRVSVASSNDAVSVDELKELQRKLQEATKLSFCNIPSVPSNSSLSTMLPDRVEVDFMDDDLDDLEFELSIEDASVFSEDDATTSSTKSSSSHFSLAATTGSNSLAPSSRPPLPQMAAALNTISATTTTVHTPDAGSETSDQDEPVTMMIRNIPNRYTQQQMLRELEDLGFTGAFNFLYVPLDKSNMFNIGYAFVNFVNPSWAAKCKQSFDGHVFKKQSKACGRTASVCPARVQGLQANLQHYDKQAATSVETMGARQRHPIVLACDGYN